MSSSPEPGKMSVTQQEFSECGQDGTLGGWLDLALLSN